MRDAASLADLHSEVFTALGAASMCWTPQPTGTFDSERALKVGQALTDYVEQNVDKKLVVLENEAVMFDPYLVRSLSEIPEDARSRKGGSCQLVFKDGGYMMLETPFDEVVTAIASVVNDDAI